MTNSWPTSVLEVLLRSGWTPGRSVDVSRWQNLYAAEGLQMHDAARSFLEEFGGLTIDIGGPGVTSVREPVRFDPERCTGEGDRFLDWSEQLDRHIVPIGDLDLGRYFLGIDEDGVVYLVETWVASFGATHEALIKLIDGYAPDVVATL
jgi:hypothetical protein